MTRTYWQIVIGLAVVATSNGCKGGEELSAEVGSLKENLPKLEQAAATWRPDAYLVSANVQLLSGHPYRPVLSGEFQSPSDDTEGILIFLEQDGSVTSERVPHPAGVIQVRPILSVDWKLDAEEALKRAVTAEGRLYLEENAESQCSFMYLERDVPTSIETVVWRVTLSGCLLEPAFQTTIVDANSGEILRRKTY